jgi:hypothetical protein
MSVAEEVMQYVQINPLCSHVVIRRVRELVHAVHSHSSAGELFYQLYVTSMFTLSSAIWGHTFHGTVTRQKNVT